MGYIKNHAIVVTSFDDKLLLKCRLLAKKIFKEEFMKDEYLPKEGSNLVSSVVSGIINNTTSFFIAPDGSKEGWETSDCGDRARKRTIDMIKDVGGGAVSYVELFFAEDNGDAEILNHN